MENREGPFVRVERSCNGCAHKVTERYTCQSDSGSDVYCTHLSVGRKHVGDTSWRTPEWCPLMPPDLIAPNEALRAEVATLTSTLESVEHVRAEERSAWMAECERLRALLPSEEEREAINECSRKVPMHLGNRAYAYLQRIAASEVGRG